MNPSVPDDLGDNLSAPFRVSQSPCSLKQKSLTRIAQLKSQKTPSTPENRLPKAVVTMIDVTVNNIKMDIWKTKHTSKEDGHTIKRMTQSSWGKKESIKPKIGTTHVCCHSVILINYISVTQ